MIDHKPSPFPADQAGEGIRRAIEWCGRMGFCGAIVDGEPRHVSDHFPTTGEVTANEFAYWVYQAEGWRDVTLEVAPLLDFGSDFRAAFVHFMGSDRVAASELKWP